MQRDVPGARIDHHISFHCQGTSGVIDLPPSLVARIVCHVLLEHLPERGLSEALESLVQMIEFYNSLEQTPALPPPAAVSKPVKIVGKYTRPEFHVMED